MRTLTSELAGQIAESLAWEADCFSFSDVARASYILSKPEHLALQPHALQKAYVAVSARDRAWLHLVSADDTKQTLSLGCFARLGTERSAKRRWLAVECIFVLTPDWAHAQAAVASPDEGGTMVVHSATQSLDTVQRAVAKTLGVAENKVLDCAWRATSVPFMWHCSQTTGQGQ